MRLLGCDLGALSTKTVILDGGGLIAFDVTPNRGRLAEAARQSMDSVLTRTGLTLEGIDHVGGTGWGQKYIPFAHSPQTMISCLAKGAKWAVPEVRTVLDLGGLSTTVVSVNDLGRVVEYRTNDRCASGTGFYLELASQALELAIEQMGTVGLAARNPVHISGQCAVFGESEIVTHVNDGAEVADIVAGVALSIGSGVATTARRLGVEPAVVITGGVAKHQGVIAALMEKLEITPAELDVDPQILGAIGAALSAAEYETN